MERRTHISKKKAKEFFRKVFGSCPADICGNALAGRWQAKYGTMTADCWVNADGMMCLALYIGVRGIKTDCYYDLQTFEIDYGYHPASASWDEE